MTSKEVDILDHVERQDKVYRAYLTGNRNPTKIAKQLGMKRAEVLDYIEQAKEIARNDEETKARAKEALHEADASLNMVLEESWDMVNDPGTDTKTKATILKNIADIEGKRVEMLQKAGLYDDAALGDELAEMEEKQQILIGILREVTADCDKCKFEVARRLAKVTGKPEPIVVDEVNQPSAYGR